MVVSSWSAAPMAQSRSLKCARAHEAYQVCRSIVGIYVEDCICFHVML